MENGISKYGQIKQHDRMIKVRYPRPPNKEGNKHTNTRTKNGEKNLIITMTLTTTRQQGLVDTKGCSPSPSPSSGSLQLPPPPTPSPATPGHRHSQRQRRNTRLRHGERRAKPRGQAVRKDQRRTVLFGKREAAVDVMSHREEVCLVKGARWKKSRFQVGEPRVNRVSVRVLRGEMSLEVPVWAQGAVM